MVASIVGLVAIAALWFASTRTAVPVGGGRSAKFPGPTVKSAVDLGGRAAVRLRSESDGRRFECVFAAGATVADIDSVNRQLFGGHLVTGTRADGVAVSTAEGTFQEPSGLPRQGRLRTYAGREGLWIVSVSADDDGTFASSRAAESFLSSLR